MITIVRKCAITLHLIPKAMERKEFLKKVFYGRLIPLKEEIEDGMCEYSPPVPNSFAGSYF